MVAASKMRNAQTAVEHSRGIVEPFVRLFGDYPGVFLWVSLATWLGMCVYVCVWERTKQGQWGVHREGLGPDGKGGVFVKTSLDMHSLPQTTSLSSSLLLLHCSFVHCPHTPPTNAPYPQQLLTLHVL